MLSLFGEVRVFPDVDLSCLLYYLYMFTVPFGAFFFFFEIFKEIIEGN